MQSGGSDRTACRRVQWQRSMLVTTPCMGAIVFSTRRYCQAPWRCHKQALREQGVDPRMGRARTCCRSSRWGYRPTSVCDQTSEPRDDERLLPGGGASFIQAPTPAPRVNLAGTVPPRACTGLGPDRLPCSATKHAHENTSCTRLRNVRQLLLALAIACTCHVRSVVCRGTGLGVVPKTCDTTCPRTHAWTSGSRVVCTRVNLAEVSAVSADHAVI